MNNVHFSIDDVFGCFNWLAKNENNVSSIFDSYVLSFAKQIHEMFGVNVSLYCMYTNGEKCLADIPDKWKNEFQENSEWLKMGFHAYKSDSCYSDTKIEDFECEYDKVLYELSRITGGKDSLTDAIRLHYFAGNDIVIKVLAQKGIRCLFCADDLRGSYNLTSDEEKMLREQKFYYNPVLNMRYVPTDIRIEHVTNIEDEIDKVRNAENGIVIFTHEIQLAKENIKITIMKFLDAISNL